MATVTAVRPRLGIAPTCRALALPRATFYRRRRPQSASPPPRPSPRALSASERAAVLALLHEPRFADLAPAEVYATLLDEGRYLCSERTMYRVLAEHHEVRERRNQLRHPHYASIGVGLRVLPRSAGINKIPAHWHPAIEHVTVISGTFNLGTGDTLETTKTTPLSAGSVAIMQPKTNHFGWTKEETIVQVHGIGPWGITYVNAADYPRKK